MAAQMHGRPFRAAKELVQPLAALDSFLPYGKKILIWHHFPAITSHVRRWQERRGRDDKSTKILIDISYLVSYNATDGNGGKMVSNQNIFSVRQKGI